MGKIEIINHIKILLRDKDDSSNCYYVEVSVDLKNWLRIIDHTNYYCCSWQFLHFSPRAVRYIKLVGTHNTKSSDFDVVTLEAYYVSKQPILINGIISPNYNVATVEMGARVIEGVNHQSDLNTMLNGDIENYGNTSGFTYHFIGQGSIVLQLGQPYYIGSMRLLLWDKDYRKYKFYIETSTNLKEWQMAVDKRDEELRSWQQFNFDPRAVVFIRFVGINNTHKTYNNVSSFDRLMDQFEFFINFYIYRNSILFISNVQIYRNRNVIIIITIIKKI